MYKRYLYSIPCIIDREQPFHTDLRFRPLVFHDLSNTSNNQHISHNNSLYNTTEIEYCLYLYETLITKYKSVVEVEVEVGCKVAVISPYRAQRQMLTRRFIDRFGKVPDNVEVYNGFYCYYYYY